jgi:hypothetical protein
MFNSTRRNSIAHPRTSSIVSRAMDVDNGLSTWVGFAMRTTVTCLVVAAFVAALSWLHRPFDWKNALESTPLRPEARIMGMIEDKPVVGFPGMLPRFFGIEYRESTPGLPSGVFGGQFGEVVCGDPIIVQLPYSEIGDRQMPLIAQASKLRGLALDGTRITDAGLEHLVGLHNLETLSISHTDVADKGLAVLGKLSALKILNISGTRVTGAGLAHLADLQRLEALDLSQTGVSADGLARLGALKKLEMLTLDNVLLDDDNLIALGTIASLRTLHLRGTLVTQVGVAKLAALIPLESCAIDGSILTRPQLDQMREK